ncbi:anaerobic glycerol-3-phosphate dehydrogenase subunit C [Thermostilla marina]
MASIDPQRAVVQDDLRGQIAGEVRCDETFTQLYAGDGSIYEIRPLGVVRPRNTNDVIVCLQYAAEHDIPVHPRGAGSGVAGESLGPGLVLDFSVFLGRIVFAGEETIRVQPGATLERVNAYLRRYGRHVPVDPDNAAVGTIGGAVARDARGARFLKYGSIGDYVENVKAVLSDGTRLNAGREAIAEHRQNTSSAKSRLVTRLAAILSENARLITVHQERATNTGCGYRLTRVCDHEHLDLARLLTGSEGTLAVFTEIELKTVPRLPARGMALLCFESLERAMGAVRRILEAQAVLCDLLERRHLSLARQSENDLEALVPEDTEAAVLVEVEGNDAPDARKRLLEIVDEVTAGPHRPTAVRQAFEQRERRMLRKLMRLNQPALFRGKDRSRPVPVLNDVAVPPNVLQEFLLSVQKMLRKYEVTASIYCHAGHGEVHLQPFFQPADDRDRDRMRRLADEFYDEVLRRRGTIGGEYGCGLARTPFIEKQYGPLADVFRSIKRTFDPLWILNPGKIVGEAGDSWLQNIRATQAKSPLRNAETPRSEAARPKDRKDRRKRKRRRTSDTPLPDILELQLNWDPAQVADIAQRCVGCGECRASSPEFRMCPVFRVHSREEASPRAKANLIRGILTGQLSLDVLGTEEFKAIADQCVHCHMCVRECPAQVDIPKLMAEGKGAYTAAHGLSLADWLLVRMDVLGKLGSSMSLLSNWAMTNRSARWVIEKLFGIAQGRKLPRFTRTPFMQRAARRGLTRSVRRSGLKVAYFVDVYANYHDPELAEAFVSVLQHNGISVFVPPDQRQAGLAAMACGALDVAARLARHNTAIFAEAVRQGYHVVATEPAVTVCLTREYPSLIDDADVRLVAQNASDASQFLWNLHLAGGLQLDFRPIHAVLGYHMPCRVKALDIGSPSEDLLRLIPGLTVRSLEAGCSGMAGTFGLKRENYRTSLRAGWGLIDRLRHRKIQAGTTECSTCKIQMEQGTTKPTIHPIKLLAAAYGLYPGGLTRLFREGRDLVVT